MADYLDISAGRRYNIQRGLCTTHVLHVESFRNSSAWCARCGRRRREAGRRGVVGGAITARAATVRDSDSVIPTNRRAGISGCSPVFS